VKVPRQCVFAGTTNSSTWLKDETGSRRFWPIRCGRIDIPAVKRDRDQLWAEALHRYRAGACLWLDDASVLSDAEEEQRARLIEDVWQSKVEEFIRYEENVTLTDVVCKIVPDTVRQDQLAANRVARCLRVAGWDRFKKRLSPDEQAQKGKKFEWRYRKAAAVE
jgi:predicted P-loop ATPase